MKLAIILDDNDRKEIETDFMAFYEKTIKCLKSNVFEILHDNNDMTYLIHNYYQVYEKDIKANFKVIK